MTAGNPDNSRNVIKYTGQNYTFTPAYMRSRDPTTNDIRDPKNQGYYPFTALWINKTNQNLWSLVRIANNLATWILFSTGGSGPLLMVNVPNGISPIVPDGLGNMFFTSAGGTVTITGSSASPNNHTINFDLAGGGVAIDTVTGDDGVAVPPDGAGNINFKGAVVASGAHAKALFSRNTAANTETYDIQVAAAIAATDITKVGLAAFQNSQFAVDANGFVTLAGSTGPAATKFHPDAFTAPGTDPVVPTAAGLVNLIGGTTFATNTQANPIRTDSLAANTVSFEIQLAGDNPAVLTANKFGVAQFDANQFDVVAGFVQLAGGGVNPAATSFPTDVGTAVPTAAGILNIKGQITPGANQSGIETTATANEVDIRMFSPFTLTDFSFDTSTAASTRTVQIQNTDNTSGTSSARENILVGGTAAGDPWTQYTIGTARSWAIGLDNSDNDTLKFKTDADATVDPSSGTFIGAMTTAGGFEFGANASGTSTASDIGSFRKDQNGQTSVAVTNGTAGTAALAALAVNSDSATGSLQVFSSSYTVDVNVADFVVLHAFANSSGLDLQTENGNLRVYGASTVIRYATMAAGIWNYPLQPSFLAYNSVADAGQAKGGNVTVQFDTEVFDQGANFAANTFTAPVAGKYLLSTCVTISGLNGATRAEIYIVTTSFTYLVASWNPTATITSGSAITGFSGSVVASMAAGNTAIVQILVDAGGGTYTIQGGAAPVETYFSGDLLA